MRHRQIASHGTKKRFPGPLKLEDRPYGCYTWKVRTLPWSWNGKGLPGFHAHWNSEIP